MKTYDIVVGKLGYYLPWSVASGALATVSYGLIATYKPDSSTGIWVGYQIIGGIGRGCGMQMVSHFTPSTLYSAKTKMQSLLAIQNSIPQQDKIPIGMALVSFSQMFGGALFLTFAQTGFSSGMRNTLKKFAPEISALTIEKAGAIGFRIAIPQSSIPGVVQSYNNSINQVFYIAVGCGFASFALAWGIGWKSVKKAKVVEPAA